MIKVAGFAALVTFVVVVLSKQGYNYWSKHDQQTQHDNFIRSKSDLSNKKENNIVDPGSTNSDVCETGACKRIAKRILDYMDPDEKPCKNFYRMACGKFLDNGIIKEDKKRNDAFEEINEQVEEQLKSLILEPIAPEEPRTYQLNKKLFHLCMDEDTLDARGVEPAVSLFRLAGGWPVLDDWQEGRWSVMEAMKKLNKLNLDGGLIDTFVYVDPKNTARRIVQVDQGRTPLPREYLVKGEEDSVVQAYLAAMVDIAVLYGAQSETATRDMQDVLRFEIQLAKLTTPKEERRDFERMYNLYDLRTLQEEIPWVTWADLLKSLATDNFAFKEDEPINIIEVEFLKKLGPFLENYPKRVVANYMFWHAADIVGDYLTRALRDRGHAFNKIITGVEKQLPRWKQCLRVSSGMSLSISSLYVKRFFDKSKKQVAEEMTDKIIQEMIDDIKTVNWMDAKTRERALQKASKITPHIGYPSEFDDISNIETLYEGLEVNTRGFFEALMGITEWYKGYTLKRLRETVNATDWRDHGDAEIVNAFYNPLENSIEFPAAVLQEPLFSADVPGYVRYATMGSIQAHECTHALDDQGSQWDCDGLLSNWWEESSKKNFEKKTKCVVDQYSKFKCSQTGLNVNGIDTQGENVADMGGLKLAYRAYHRQLRAPEPLLPGLTSYTQDQLFMLTYANSNCCKWRDAALRHQIETNEHAPEEFRVNGPVMNMPEFSRIFGCKKGDKMFLRARDMCVVW